MRHIASETFRLFNL